MDKQREQLRERVARAIQGECTGEEWPGAGSDDYAQVAVEHWTACADRALDVALRAAYGVLRQHAAAYRNTKGFKAARGRWEENRVDPDAARRAAVHEWFARGIEAAARDMAELLGVPEYEIDDAEGSDTGDGDQAGQ